MELNTSQFKEIYKQLFKKDFEKELPKTYEELLENLIDPDDFGIKTKYVVETLKNITEQTPDYIAHESLVITLKDKKVFLGNLIVEGDLTIDSHTYILGNLEVKGVIYGGIHCILLVGGNISAQGMCLTRSYGFVLGDIHVAQYAYFNTYGIMMLLGKLKAKLYIMDDTWENLKLSNQMHYKKNLEADKFFDISEVNNKIIKKLKEVFIDEAIKIEEGEMDIFYPFELISQNKYVLKN